MAVSTVGCLFIVTAFSLRNRIHLHEGVVVVDDFQVPGTELPSGIDTLRPVGGS